MALDTGRAQNVDGGVSAQIISECPPPLSLNAMSGQCISFAIQTPPAVKEEDVKEHLQLFGTMVHFEISNTPKAKALVAGFATLSEAADAYLGTLNHPFKPEGGGKSLFVDTLMFVPNTKGGNTKADGS